MSTLRTRGLLSAAALVAGLSLAACDQQPDSQTSGRAVERPGDKVAMPVENAMSKASEIADDTAITAQVKAALLAEAGLQSLQISVETERATVTLAGDVESAAQRDRVKEVATGVSGVKRVVDEMTIKS